MSCHGLQESIFLALKAALQIIFQNSSFLFYCNMRVWFLMKADFLLFFKETFVISSTIVKVSFLSILTQ